MGQVSSIFSNRNGHVRGQAQAEDLETQVTFSNANGSYFGSHFLMCGCKFELAKPEAYLFGENKDLDHLGIKPIHFPYPLGPLGHDEIRPLNLLVNIRKESVKFLRIRKENGEYEPDLYQIHCILDCDAPCVVQVHYHSREVYIENDLQFVYRNKRANHSEKYNFDVGADQVFSSYIFDASQWELGDLAYTAGLFFPIVISIQTAGVDRPQTQTTLCSVDVFANDTSKSLTLKPLRQKIACDGLTYLLQEIFGIENKEPNHNDVDDGGLECIICLSDIRDTVILPCRHLCVCSNCADNLRYKHNNCPICRAPFRAIIRLRGQRQTRNQIYETFSLVEGLNGLNRTDSTEEPLSKRNSIKRKSMSNKCRGALNQVLTMEQLGEKALDTECIEMTYICNETGEDNDRPDEMIKEIVIETFDEGSSASTSQSSQIVNEIEKSPQPSAPAESDEEDEESDDEDEEHGNKSENGDDSSLKRGSRNSSSQLLEHKEKN